MITLSHLEPYAGDPILSLNEAFQQDPRAGKVNLSVGIYFDEDGRVPIFDCVRQAEAQMLAEAAPKPYLPMEGDPAMRHAVAALLLGSQHEALRQQRVCTIQTVGSSGGLRVGAEFIKRWFPHSDLWVSDPTWDNHRSVFEAAGLRVHTYPYYDKSTGGVCFEALCEALDQLPAHAVVLLHGCCHNPTGVDLTAAQWDQVIDIVLRRNLLAFVDLAYQGYGDGLEEDAYAVRALAQRGATFLVANSFSKSMSVYGERAGALSVVCPDAAQAQLALGQLKAVIRRFYSSPALHAAGIVSRVLSQPTLRSAWEADVAGMRNRIVDMRQALHAALRELCPHRSVEFIIQQRGMFTYTGLSAQQVDRLREEFAVYLVRSGRLCLTGLNRHNMATTAQALARVMS